MFCVDVFYDIIPSPRGDPGFCCCGSGPILGPIVADKMHGFRNATSPPRTRNQRLCRKPVETFGLLTLFTLLQIFTFRNR